MYSIGLADVIETDYFISMSELMSMSRSENVLSVSAVMLCMVIFVVMLGVPFIHFEMLYLSIMIVCLPYAYHTP